MSSDLLIDASTLTEWQACPHKTMLMRWDGLAPEGGFGSAAAFGTIVHKAMELQFLGEPLPVAYKTALAEAPEYAFDDKRTPEKAAECITALNMLVKNTGYTQVSAEEKWILDGFTGRFDGRWEAPDGLRIGDYKTSGQKKKAQDFKYTVQRVLYQWAGQQMHAAEGMSYFIVTTTKVPQTEELKIDEPIGPQIITRLQELAAEVRTAVSTGCGVAKNPAACLSKFGEVCPFYANCWDGVPLSDLPLREVKPWLKRLQDDA